MVISNCNLAFTLEDGTTYRLKASIACNPEHSSSAVIAISDYLYKNFPEITPPYPQHLNQKIQQKTTCAFSPLCGFWNAYLVESVYKELACRQGNEFYIIVPLDHWNGEINKVEFFEVQHFEGLSQLQPQEQLSKIFNISPIKSAKRIGIYQTHPRNHQQCEPYNVMDTLILGIFFNNQQWKIFNIPKNEVPSVEELLSLDAIIITGSIYSVLDQTEPISFSLKNLMLAFNASKKIKIFGICYGHQLIAQHFGSNISTKPTIGGLEVINMNKQIIQKFPFLQGLKYCQDLHMSQLHSDHVDDVPVGFHHLASSKSCNVQALISEDGRILTSQFHPEKLFSYVKVMAQAFRSNGISNIGYNFDIEQGLDVKNSKDSVIFLDSIQAFLDE